MNKRSFIIVKTPFLLDRKFTQKSDSVRTIFFSNRLRVVQTFTNVIKTLLCPEIQTEIQKCKPFSMAWSTNLLCITQENISVMSHSSSWVGIIEVVRICLPLGHRDLVLILKIDFFDSIKREQDLVFGSVHPNRVLGPLKWVTTLFRGQQDSEKNILCHGQYQYSLSTT